ncbi:hypothetical protein M3A49_35350 [Paraburkholderia sp. CNPSo 3076]|uniref:hypothetical protein n=1 Tax=Paraburkholderia sp. CNPSo 3076 TaxID=2940936 RepID=UPI00225A0C65|nr:hypothetical protein [Paraburkholderia sp. CNPSo 3076]MCX5544683.1 hypothetical protein [Paraburkholderia sp. CNPSo 3076]
MGVIATCASIAISLLAGRERGGTPAEQLVWMVIGLSLLLGAHLIPAIAQGAKRSVRLVGGLLWLAAMASTGYTHGTFFLSAQQHAGDVRAGQVAVPGAVVEKSSTSNAIAALLRQQAKLQGTLNQSMLIKCGDDCRPEAEPVSITELIEPGHEPAEADEETLLREALAAGAATNSIADIVRVLGCSESRALALRRVIATTSPRLLMVCGA